MKMQVNCEFLLNYIDSPPYHLSLFKLIFGKWRWVLLLQAMIAGDHKFHPECFCCFLCQQYIGDGDSYALVERSKLFW